MMGHPMVVSGGWPGWRRLLTARVAPGHRLSASLTALDPDCPGCSTC